jgi:uncharacterized coiled-coil DUF342 family protein
MGDDEQELEATIKGLTDRRNSVPEGSAEYEAIVRELGRLFESHEDAQLIAEEYNSLLGTIDNDEQELENTIRQLIERRDAAREGSAEYRMVIRQLKGLRNSKLAEEIMEEYGYALVRFTP